MNYYVLYSTLHPSSPQRAPNCARKRSLPWHPLLPGCLGERSNSPAGSGRARPPHMNFDSKTKYLAMTDLEAGFPLTPKRTFLRPQKLSQTSKNFGSDVHKRPVLNSIGLRPLFCCRTYAYVQQPILYPHHELDDFHFFRFLSDF